MEGDTPKRHATSLAAVAIGLALVAGLAAWMTHRAAPR
jgi:hypothetical protein